MGKRDFLIDEKKGRKRKKGGGATLSASTNSTIYTVELISFNAFQYKIKLLNRY
jgi:hypothetical protein